MVLEFHERLRRRNMMLDKVHIFEWHDLDMNRLYLGATLKDPFKYFQGARSTLLYKIANKKPLSDLEKRLKDHRDFRHETIYVVPVEVLTNVRVWEVNRRLSTLWNNEKFYRNGYQFKTKEPDLNDLSLSYAFESLYFDGHRIKNELFDFKQTW